MRFITLRVLCEGQTEAAFVRNTLRPHLSTGQIFARDEPLSRGHYGIVGFERLRAAIKADVGRSRNHEFVTTMIDLYGIGSYPGAERIPGESPYARVARIEAMMAEDLPNPRFIPYVQLHEFEALVLTDVTRIPNQFPDGEADHAPAILMSEIGEVEPELINDGESTAPSKRLIRCIRAYDAAKATAGPAIVADIGLARLRERCRHFNEWITILEALSVTNED